MSSIIVGEAVYYDQEICREIVDSDGEYLVIVNVNQPTLHHDARAAFVVPEGYSPYVRKAHVVRKTVLTKEKRCGRC